MMYWQAIWGSHFVGTMCLFVYIGHVTSLGGWHDSVMDLGEACMALAWINAGVQVDNFGKAKVEVI